MPIGGVLRVGEHSEIAIWYKCAFFFGKVLWSKLKIIEKFDSWKCRLFCLIFIKRRKETDYDQNICFKNLVILKLI